MSPGSRCDEILRLIDEVLGDTGTAGATGPVPAPRPVEAAAARADRRVAAAAH